MYLTVACFSISEITRSVVLEMQLNMQFGRIVWHDIVFHWSTWTLVRFLSRFQTFEKVSCSIKYGNKRYDIVHSITIVKTGDKHCYDF